MIRIVLPRMRRSRFRVRGARGGYRGRPRCALAGRPDLCGQPRAVAFPCLEVNVSDRDERGYVVLRPPLRQPDLILSPTRKIVGVEDPSLQTLDAANYFEDAWNARTFLQGAPEEPLARDDVVLAVNSRSSRTPDQLHIHIGCPSPTAKQVVSNFGRVWSSRKLSWA